MARTSRSKRTSSRTISIDFSGVEAGRFRPPEGDYRVKIDRVEKTQSAASRNDQLEFTFEIIEGKFEGKVFKDWFSLVKEALWRLSGFLSSLNIEVPESELDLDLDELAGKTVGVVMEHREYNGNIKSTIRDHYPLDGETETSDEEEEEGEEEEKKPARKSSAKDEKKSKKLTPLSGDEVIEMSEDELEEVVERYELEINLEEFKTLRKKQNAVCDALEEKDLLES